MKTEILSEKFKQGICITVHKRLESSKMLCFSIFYTMFILFLALKGVVNQTNLFDFY